MSQNLIDADKDIRELFVKAREMILAERNYIDNEDFRRQCRIIERMQYGFVDEEAGILNQLVVQGLSYSKLRKFAGVYYPDSLLSGRNYLK